jgi:hypothetical protein
MARGGLLLATVVVLAVATACGDPSAAPTQTATDVALYEPEGAGGHDAQLAGVLDRVEGCVVVRVGEPTTLVVPVLPVGARWDGDELVAVGQRHRLGDHVDWRGGELAFGDTSWLAQVPSGCEDLDMWVVYP